MKESLASPFAHLPFVQAAVSAKNHSQASPERRGGRVKDSREDELPLRTWQQANTNRREEEFPPLDNLDLFCRRTKHSFYWYAPGKQTDTGLQEHSLSFCHLPLFFFILFSSQNVRPRVETRPALSALFF